MTKILIPEYMVPDFCPKCTAPIVNKRLARLVNPKRRKRVPFCCAKSKFLGLGGCEWQGWISPNPVAVGIVLWCDPRSKEWFVLVEKRGIPPGMDREAFVAGYVEPGHTCAETSVHELRQEVGLDSKTIHWRYVGQTSPMSNPMLLLSFYVNVRKTRRMPRLRPDYREVANARWVHAAHVDRADLAWPEQVAMVRRALYLVDPERFSRLP